MGLEDSVWEIGIVLGLGDWDKEIGRLSLGEYDWEIGIEIRRLGVRDWIIGIR